MEKKARIYIAGHSGMVGSAISSILTAQGYKNLITRTHQELDLMNCDAVAQFFQEEKPEYVILAAARVGGIEANNTYRGNFIFENLMIQTNIIHHSYLQGVKKLLFLGSTCIYPKNSPQPIKEEYLLTDTLEYTNEPYAIAKIAGIKMCESYNIQHRTNFIAVMPTNLYGPKDNFNLETSHVLPALIRKIHLGKALEEGNWEAIAEDLNRRPIQGVDGSQGKKEMLAMLSKYGINYVSSKQRNKLASGEEKVVVEIWGSGKQVREFLWSDDMAEACIFLMKNIDFIDLIPRNLLDDTRNEEIRNTQVNIGTGREITILHLAEIIKTIIKYKGELFFNTRKPEGTARKRTDVTKIGALGWRYSVEVDEGVFRLYNWYKSSVDNKAYIRK